MKNRVTIPTLFCTALLAVGFSIGPGIQAQEPESRCLIQNGNTNGDNLLDISDAVHLLSFLYLGGSEPKPQYVADVQCVTTLGEELAVAKTDLAQSQQALAEAQAEASAAEAALSECRGVLVAREADIDACQTIVSDRDTELAAMKLAHVSHLRLLNRILGTITTTASATIPVSQSRSDCQWCASETSSSRRLSYVRGIAH